MDRLEDAVCPAITQKVAWQSVEEEAVVIDLDARRVMGLNATGSFLWSRMDGKTSVASLSQAVAEAFAVEQERARADVEGFLVQMQQRGLVQW